jgi:hypothetical protein
MQLIINIFKNRLVYIFLNAFSILLLGIWLFRSCINLEVSITSLFLDFLVMITFIYTIVRVTQSLKGDFKVMDMVTLYYASLFFLFSWLTKAVSNFYDFLYVPQYDLLNLFISVFVFITLFVNFTVTEKINLDNLEKIESEI